MSRTVTFWEPEEIRRQVDNFVNDFVIPKGHGEHPVDRDPRLQWVIDMLDGFANREIRVEV